MTPLDPPHRCVSRRTVLAAGLGGGVAAIAGCASSTGPIGQASSPDDRSGVDRSDDNRSDDDRSADDRSGDNDAVHTSRVAYGADAAQFAELYRPAKQTHAGTVVLIHGGFWRAEYGLSLGEPLARDLAGRGYTCWNIEYRRVGAGGGWPATLDDVAAAIDALTHQDVDTDRVVAVGHSAGGQLAVWAAGRGALPAGAPGAAPVLRLTAAVSQAGVLDLRTAADTQVGGFAVPDLLGGTPAAQSERYRLADPIEQVPLRVPVLCVHAEADANVPYSQSTDYVRAAAAAGASARLHTVPGDHFTLIDPTTPAWAVVRDALPDLLTGRLPA